MHSYDAPNGTKFNYNPDMSGNVRIIEGRGEMPDEVLVSGDDLLAFFLQLPWRVKDGQTLTYGDALKALERMGAATGEHP